MGKEGLARGPYDKGRTGRKDRQGQPPTRAEEFRWARLKLEAALAQLARYPEDRVMTLVVIRLRQELAEAKSRL